MQDLQNYDAALKEYYSEQVVENMIYKNNPFFALVPKFENMVGRNYPQPIVFSNPQGRSANFTRAQTRGAVSQSKIDAFLMTRVKNYQIATIDNELIKATKNDMGAFMEAATLEIDGAINNLSRDLAVDMYRSGFGARGRIKLGSAVTGTSLLLETGSDVTNFEVGMELDVATTEGASVLKAYGSSGNGLLITKVNRSVGSESITLGFAADDATNGIPTIAAGDYFFVRGDRENSASPSLTKLAGLAAWLPTSAPSATSFFGVDRSIDATRLGGQRIVATNRPIEEAAIDLSVLIAREGGAPDYAFLNPLDWADLEKSLGSKVVYVDTKVNVELGFRGIEIMGQKGNIKILPDMNCPKGLMYMVQLNTWKLGSIDKAVGVIDTDGLQMLRMGTSDAVECRYGFYGNLMCKAPGFNGVATIG